MPDEYISREKMIADIENSIKRAGWAQSSEKK